MSLKPAAAQRIFLFPPSGTEFTQLFTDEIVTLDPEFPVAKNISELRMMAGLIMVACFENPSEEADAFALGLRAANFPSKRVQPIEPTILSLGEKYIGEEANRLRPSDFDADSPEFSKTLTRRVNQLAEESALLWWVLAEYSDTLCQHVNSLDREEYALAAAAEAAQRTITLPPPPSMHPLLTRALKPCKSPEKKLGLADYIKSTNPDWRSAYTKSLSSMYCSELSPICIILKKLRSLEAPPQPLKLFRSSAEALKLIWLLILRKLHNSSTTS